MKKGFFLLIIAFCIQFFVWAKENIALDLQVGFSGVVYSLSPNTLVKATLTNQGTSSFKGFIGVKGYTLEKVELSPGEKKTFFYLVGGRCGTVKFGVFSPKKKTILSRPIPCGVMQDEPLHLVLPPKQVPSLPWLVGVGVEDLPPDWRAYMDVELIVVEGNTLEGLNKEQKENILKWLELGGRMIIVGDEDLSRQIGEFTASLLPLRNVKKVTLPHPPSAFLNTPIPPKDITTTIYSGFPVGKVDLYENGYPLIVERSIGWGNVQYWAFQPWSPPFNDWQGMPLILPSPSSKRPTWWIGWDNFPYGGLEEWNLFPASIEGLGKISFKVVLLFSLIFTYILVPSLYITLRIKRKTSAYWLSSLICVLLVSLAIFLYGWVTKEHQTVVKELSLTHFYPNVDNVNQIGIVGIYSPLTRRFSLLFERKDTMLNELDTCGEPQGFFYVENGKKVAEDLRVPRWGIRTYEYCDWRKGRSPIEAEFSLEGNLIKGWLKNKESKPVKNLLLVFGQKAYSIGDIEGGERKELSIDIEKSKSLIGMKFGTLFFPLEELMKRTPAGRVLTDFNKANVTNCALVWEGESSPSIGEVKPSPGKIYRKSVYIQHLHLPVSKLPNKVPFVLAYFAPPRFPGAEETMPFFPSVSQLWGSPFEFFGYRQLAFTPKIEGVKFSKVIIDIQLDSKSPADVSLSIRRGKKTYKMETVAQAKSPGHLTYNIDKPDEFLMGGRYLYTELEQETFSFFGKIEIKRITVYGIPKGG